MKAFLRAADDFMRGRGRFAADAATAGRLPWLFGFVLAFGLVYGIVMATSTGLAPGRWHQLVYSGVKVPLLMLATFGLCLPSFFVLNTVAGLRDDFPKALRAVVATQSCIAVLLAALAPLTAVFYASCANYGAAIAFNGLMFGVAWTGAQVVARRYYADLIRRSPLHRTMLYAWFIMYIFVGVQMAWVLRPFVGDPGSPVAFFRPDAWGNAYVRVARILGGLLHDITGS